MSLDKATLKTTFVTIFMKDRSGQSKTDAINDASQELADAVDTFTKTGEVNTTVGSGIPCTVNSVSHNGATTETGSGEGNIT